MKRSVRLSPMLLLVALSPVFFQTAFSCERGDTFLLSLEFEAYGQNRIAGFNLTTRDYALFNSSPTAIVRTVTRDPGSTATYDLSVGGTSIEVGMIGVGGGEVTINVPAGQSQLTIAVRAPEGPFGISTGRYTIDINPPCSPGECDDGNSCTTDVCNSSVCEFTTLADGVVCDDGNGGQDLCNAGVCPSNAVTRTIPMACTTTALLGWLQAPAEFELTVDPLDSVVEGMPFSAAVSGVVHMPSITADIYTIQDGGGATRIAFVDGSVSAVARSGAVGPNVPLQASPLPTTCAVDANGNRGLGAGPFPTCDPSNNTGSPTIASIFANTGCVGLGGAPSTDNPCLPFRDLTVIDGTADGCAACMALDASNVPLLLLSNACATFGFCRVLGDASFSTTNELASLDANTGATEALFGFEESAVDPPLAPLIGDGFTLWVESEGAVGTSLFRTTSLECFMGELDGLNTLGNSVLTPAPDSALVSIPVSPDWCATTPIDCSGSTECLTDGVCDPVCEPGTGCDRCPGQDQLIADGTSCGGGSGTCQSGVCEPNPPTASIQWLGSGECGLWTGTVLPLRCALSEDGSVAVYAAGASGSRAGWKRFREGIGIDVFDPDNWTQRMAITADGTTVVGGSWRWNATGGHDVALLSVDRAISADGQWTAGQYGGVYSAIGPFGLLTLPGTAPFVTATSGNGEVVVGAVQPLGGGPAIWTFDSLTQQFNLFTPSWDGLESTGRPYAQDVSYDGSVVVGGGQFQEAFKWTAAEGVVSLGSLSATPTDGWATGVSDDGTRIVGTTETFVGGGFVAFLWEAAPGMRRLDDVLADDYGLTLEPGSTLTYVGAISGDGKKILGMGSDPSGNGPIFLVTLGTP